MEEFYKPSRMTGKTYNVFESISILNLKQATSYMEHGVFPLDIYPSKDKKTGKPCLVFIFNRNDTKVVYDLWCKHELD